MLSFRNVQLTDCSFTVIQINSEDCHHHRFLDIAHYADVTSLVVLKFNIVLECFKYFGSILTNDGRCTCEIKSRIAMAKAAFNKKKTLFTSKLGLNLRKK